MVRSKREDTRGLVNNVRRLVFSRERVLAEQDGDTRRASGGGRDVRGRPAKTLYVEASVRSSMNSDARGNPMP